MPPRKEPKETVTYPASKRKAPPFKPQRPSKAPRPNSSEPPTAPKRNGSNGFAKGVISSMTPAKSGRSRQMKAGADRRAALARKKATLELSSDEEGSDTLEGVYGVADNAKEDSDSDSELADDPLTANAKRNEPPRSVRPTAEPPSQSGSSQQSDNNLPTTSSHDHPNSVLDESNTATSIPQPLLVRLLYEHFRDKQMKIDKHAIQVLGKYFEVFLREAIARAALQKREDVEQGAASQSDVGWLELQDLEKVAPGLLMDF